MAFDDPTTLALLGAAAGFLDPQGGMMGGFQGAMNGLKTGNAMQQAKMQNEMKQRQILQQIEMQNYLQQHVQAGTPIREVVNKALLSGNQDLINWGINTSKSLPKVKDSWKTVGDNGKVTYSKLYDTGDVEGTDMTPYERPMQVNTGDKVNFIDPATKQIAASFGVNMSPGERARLAQDQYQFGQSHDLARRNYALNEYKSMMPQYQSGQWITPPMPGQAQGQIQDTEYYSPPKGSAAEKQKLRGKVLETLGTDTPDLIKKSTGSYAGQAVDFAGRVIGKSTPGAEALNQLKIRATTLAGNMPQFEGPQSDADRKYYLEMAGDLANPDKTTDERLAAYNELLRIHSLADENGTIVESLNQTPTSNKRKSYISPDGFSSRVKE